MRTAKGMTKLKAAAKKKVAVKKSALKKVATKKANDAKVLAAAKVKALKATIADLKAEVSEMKGELKRAKSHENAILKMTDKRAEAVGKFLSSWDKKAMSGLERPKKRGRKKKIK